MMKNFRFFQVVAFSAALVFQGCATVNPAKVDDSQSFSKIKTAYGHVTPQEIGGGEAVYVALINVDFSQTHLVFDFNIGSFIPKKDSGAVYLKIGRDSEPLASLAELGAVLEKHTLEAPIGIIMMIDGQALGVGGNTPKPEQNDFFKDFAKMMSEVGIRYAYIVPESVKISR